MDAAVRRVVGRDPATFEYLGRTGNRELAYVRFVRSPEEAARQGRTQVYQAVARSAGKPARRRAEADQMALFDDLVEVVRADEADEDERASEEEGMA
ncbi:MAG: hypothetical protein AB1673_15355 [Actinomycetota bacterium]